MPPASLAGRFPEVPRHRLLAQLVPPPRFDAVRFETYLPGPAHPSQAEAVRGVRRFARCLAPSAPGRRWWPPRRRRDSSQPRGIYLDGGFGVGKTHLLASLWHVAPQPKAYATFVELTHLVGALGFAEAVEALGGHRLLCIDEFELDDPGDTVLVSTLLSRLVERGVALAATSNTLPGRLGEGRFAAQDFLREIQGLAASFTVVRIEGDDFRHRGLPSAPPPYDDAQITAAARATEGATLDDWGELLAHLQELHPVRYGALLDGVEAVYLRCVAPLSDQAAALRLVVLADRLYDRDVPVVASGAPFDELFPEELLRGGYRKKYFRAISRLVALAREGEGLDAPDIAHPHVVPT